MQKFYLITCVYCSVLLLSSCGETWSCEIDGSRMFSVSSSGEIGSADKGCSCNEIREFELEQTGSVDEEALKFNFGC